MTISESGQNSGSWSVAATVNEPVVLLQAFVAHHIDLGADEVILYLDDPSEDVLDLLGPVPGCRLVACDEGWWNKVQGKRAHGSHVRRQLDNISHAYDTCRSEWLLHLDADEFLQAGQVKSVSHMLAAMPEGLDCAKIRNAERIWPEVGTRRNIFEGMFRLPFFATWSDTDELVRPEARPFLYRGVAAYAQGKSFTRTGRSLLPGIHSARGIKGHANHWVVPGVEVLHFDGLTPLHWASKLMRFADFAGHLSEKNFGHARLAQIRHVMNQNDAARRIRNLHDLLKVLSDGEVERLRGLGLLRDPGFDPMMALARCGLSADLGIAAFDAEIVRRNPCHARLIEQWQAMDQTEAAA